jgi:AraC-like DNA-binding protein
MRSRPVPRGVRLYDPATLARLCRARDYLGDRFNRRTSLEEAARQAYLSPFYFSRLFAEAFGETLHEFVTRLRIERAKRLLLANHASVTEICLDVGYESLGSFSTRFRTLTGLSPAAFRREARRIFGFRGGACSTCRRAISASSWMAAKLRKNREARPPSGR